jgi:antitoxin component YwqK of YwqJK toxin-antitoxin module
MYSPLKTHPSKKPLMKVFLPVFLLMAGLSGLAQPGSVLRLQQPEQGIDFNRADSLQRLGLVYNTHIGETYIRSEPATGWRSDTANGRGQKIYSNPYDNYYTSEKQRHDSGFVFYRYLNGKRFSGNIADSLNLIPHGKQIEFAGTCVNGLMQGTGYLYFTDNDYYSLDSVKIGRLKCRGNFEDGEMTGEWVYYDCNGSIRDKKYYKKGTAYPQKIISFRGDSEVVLFDDKGIPFKKESYAYWTPLNATTAKEPVLKNPYDNHLFCALLPANRKSNKNKWGVHNDVFIRTIDGIPLNRSHFDGVLHKGKFLYSFVAGYRNGLLQGEAIFYFTSNDSIDISKVPLAGSYGFGGRFKAGGLKAKGVFENGKMAGEWIYYDYRGSIIEKRWYNVNRRFPDSTVALRNGKVAVKAYYKEDDKMPAQILLYSADGYLSSREDLVQTELMDRKTGQKKYTYQVTRYHENGVVEARGQKVFTREAVKNTGIWEYYNKEGKLNSRQDFKKGRR